MSEEPRYPMVTCYRHEGLQQAYVLCPHVASGKAPEHHAAPTNEHLGEALCTKCAAALVSKDEVEAKKIYEACQLACKPCCMDLFGRKLQN